MGYYLLLAAGLIGPFVLIYYREMVGNMFGEADWMRKVGGVHYVIVYIAMIIFFWTLAEATGTTSILFAPMRSLSPAFQHQAPTMF
ncbi:hypothetical protein EXS70_02265 [Candidatus Peribacteria bacterium]|nr:hypothetical protein [Candidatus Peribacteria bacterium]